jgi:hypothetical protein
MHFICPERLAFIFALEPPKGGCTIVTEATYNELLRNFICHSLECEECSRKIISSREKTEAKIAELESIGLVGEIKNKEPRSVN